MAQFIVEEAIVIAFMLTGMGIGAVLAYIFRKCK
jgi:hypothetical protein